jgi:ABC-type proline/glycine betaine transport system permease subunit
MMFVGRSQIHKYVAKQPYLMDPLAKHIMLISNLASIIILAVGVQVGILVEMNIAIQPIRLVQ